jgi:hypothetical protein
MAGSKNTEMQTTKLEKWKIISLRILNKKKN